MPLLYSIPDQYKGGFKALAELSNADFLKLKKSLSKAPFVSSINKLVGYIYSTEFIKSSEINQIEEIFESVGSLIVFIEKREIIDEIIQDIVVLARLAKLINGKNRNNFEKRVTDLVNSEQIYYAGKADKLSTHYGNVYIQSRIVSDIRPVFDIDISNEVKAALIVHNLSIHYDSNEEPFHKNITLTLTSEDIKSLKEILNRAEKKEEGLKIVFNKATIKNLNENNNEGK